MDNEDVSKHDVADFLSTLSNTATVAAIEVDVGAAEFSLVLDVSYLFAVGDADDGKPVVLAVVNTPFRLENAEAHGARLSDPDADDGAISESTGAILVDPTAGDWNAIRITLRLGWSATHASPSPGFLSLPEQLPRIIAANAFRGSAQAIPRFALSLAPSAAECLAGGIVEGTTWPAGPHSMRMLEAVLVTPGTKLLALPVPSHEPEARHSVALTRAAASGCSRRDLTVFAEHHARLVLSVEQVFGIRLTLRHVAATPAEMPPASGPGASTILPYETIDLSDQYRANRYMSELIQYFAFAWWGGGVRIVGLLKDSIHLGMAMCAALLLLQEHLDLPINTDSMMARLAAAPSHLRREDWARASSPLGIALFNVLRFEVADQQALRDLTQSWWGRQVPDREFIQWCVVHRVEVPTQLLPTEWHT